MRKYPTYKEVSQRCDEVSQQNAQKKKNVIKKFFFWIFTCTTLSFLYAIIERVNERQIRDSKYKKVIKQHWFGAETIEWHER